MQGRTPEEADERGVARLVAYPLERLLHGEGLPAPTAIRYGVATALVGAAFAIRLTALPEGGGYAFLTFYPAVILSGLLFGAGPAALAALLSGIGAMPFVIESAPEADGRRESIVVTAFFGCSAALILVLVHSMRRAIGALRLGESRLLGLIEEQRALIDNRLAGIVKLRNRRIVWANAAFSAMFGYAPGELVGRPSRILYTSDEAHAQFAENAFGAIARGEVYRTELEQRRKDGTSGWFAISCTRLAPHSDEQIGVFVDVSDRHAAQRALYESEGRLRQAQSIAHVGHWERVHTAGDRESIPRHWSDEMFRIYGIVPSGSGPSAPQRDAAIHPDDREATERAVRDAIAAHAPIDFRQRIVWPDGSLRYVHVRGETTYADDGRPLRSFGTAQDVTESVMKEEALRRSERRLRTVFETMSEGLVIQARDGRVVDANPASLEILGLTRDQALGRSSIDPQWRAVREDGAPFPGESHPAMITLRTGMPLRNQIMGVHSPGRGLRWISINSAPIPAERTEEADAVVTTFTDVSDQRAAFERVRELVRRLENVRADERRAVALSLHEGVAQNLFAAKLGLSNLLDRLRANRELASAGRHVLDAIDQCMDDLRQVANELHPVAIAHQSLAELLERHAAEFAKRSGLAIEVTEAAPLPRLGEAAELILFRAVQEALTNVARHARAHEVRIVLRAGDGQVRIEIGDDGIGVEPAALRKPGSLGLVAIRERLAELHGDLEIAARAPRGTTVTLRVPQSPAAQ